MAIAAHPFRDSYGLGDKVFDLDLDGIEIYNSNHSASCSRKASCANDFLSLAGIGASDAHDLLQLGHFLTEFVQPITNESELVAEILAKRCKPITYSYLP